MRKPINVDFSAQTAIENTTAPIVIMKPGNMIREWLERFRLYLFKAWSVTPTPPRGRVVVKGGDHNRGPVAINLYATEKLRGRNGRHPESMAEKYIGRALDRAQYNYTIRWGFDPIDAPTERAVCDDVSSDTVFWWWDANIKNDQVEVAKDANILITDARGGGCSWAGRNVSTAPGRYIDQYRPYEETGEDDWHSNINAILHELGHCLGASHDHDPSEPGMQHAGMGWNDHEDEVWHRTPNCVGGGAPNICGEEVPEREYERRINHQYYHDCAIDRFVVK